MNVFTRSIMTFVVLASTALAGPPLICHPFLTGGEPSLPWSGGKDGWKNPDPRYDVKNLTTDTLKVLESSSSLLARMETIRRAVVYSSRNSAAGMELGTRLMSLALSSEVKGQANSLALFDAGYFVETMKQMSPISKSNDFAGIDGYEWVRRSVPGLQDKLTAEYALGLIQSSSSWPNEHIRRAVAGAQEGSLLAQNLLKQFQNKTLAELKRTLSVKSASL